MFIQSFINHKSITNSLSYRFALRKSQDMLQTSKQKSQVDDTAVGLLYMSRYDVIITL